MESHMTDEATTTAAPAAAPEAPRSDAKTGKSSYRSAPAAASTVDSRQNGGAGVQRSHLRNRKAWLKRRTRAGQTWAQRKANSLTYCPAKVQRTS
jgi:hypothetical protein